MLFSADFYKTTEEAKEQMLQYFQSPEEDEADPEGGLCVLHRVELTEKDREYLQEKTGNIVDKIQEIDSRIGSGSCRLENAADGQGRTYHPASGPL